MSDTDRKDWFDAVAGRSPQRLNEQQEEAAQVRAYFLKRIREDSEGKFDPQREIRMMNYLRAKGALTPASGGKSSTTWASSPLSGLARFLHGLQKRWAIAAAAVAVLILAPMVLSVLLVGAPTPVQAPAPKVAEIRTTDPAQAVRDIESALKAAGIVAHSRAEDSAWIVWAQIDPAHRDEAQRRLAPFSLSVPASGHLVVRVQAP